MYIYNIVCILYLHRLVHLIFPILEGEKVSFIYSLSLIYWLSNRWRAGFQTGGGKRLWIGFTWIVGGK